MLFGSANCALATFRGERYTRILLSAFGGKFAAMNVARLLFAALFKDGRYVDAVRGLLGTLTLADLRFILKLANILF